jgi:HptB-dependent secretion and biofilm anti anti-sigma factor
LLRIAVYFNIDKEMAMAYPVDIADDKASIHINGRFDFSMFREFQQSYENLLTNAAVRTITLDLSGTEYIDSAALGMMLLLRQKCGDADKHIELLNPQDRVKEVLQIANFHQFFA